MSATGSTFKDWYADEADMNRSTGRARSGERRGRRQALLVDDDFSWSDAPPARSSRADTERASVPARRGAASSRGAARVRAAGTWDDGLDLEHELDDAWGGRLSEPAGAGRGDVRESRATDTLERAEPELEYAETWDESTLEPIADGPRTVVITGHGAERQVPMGRRRRDSGLRIHERAGFNPDRVAMWAFLLGIALVLGAIVH
jgi:hypothetical protein